MICSRNVTYMPCKTLAGLFLSVAVISVYSQVLPSEVSNPGARAAESKYLPQLETLQKEIGTATFPNQFQLARYLNAKSGRAAMDRDGIEFVNFQHRIVLKVSGIYEVAFEAGLQAENVRATRTLVDAGIPLLRMAANAVPGGNDYDGIGLEIIYGTRDTNSAYKFEGREVLSAVFSRADALALANARNDAERQEILSRSDVYVNGQPFGVTLGQRDPIGPNSSERSSNQSGSREAGSNRTGSNDQELERAATLLRASLSRETTSKPDGVAEPIKSYVDTAPTKSELAPALEARLEPPTALVAGDRNAANSNLGGSEAPLLEHSGDQVLLHVSLQNSLSFNGAESSIYKRAAQSFDLFLAPGLRELMKTLPTDAKYDALKFSVVNRVSNGMTPSETIDYICPVQSTRSFLDNKITSQDLINQSMVLVNGVRIGLNLQTAE
jgi:hypothetical protein